MALSASKVLRVPFGIYAAIAPSCVNIGCADYAKRATNANSYTNTIWLKCRNATSIHDSTHAITKNAHSCTSIRKVKSKIVHGMIAASVGMVHCAVIGMCDASSAQIIWPDFAPMEPHANTCIRVSNCRRFPKYQKIRCKSVRPPVIFVVKLVIKLPIVKRCRQRWVKYCSMVVIVVNAMVSMHFLFDCSKGKRPCVKRKPNTEH